MGGIMVTKIWHRYMLLEFIKTCSFFLFSFFFLYVVLDFSTHMQDFVQQSSVPITKILLYYLFQFVKRADILLPLALLVGTIKVLCRLNTQKELVAFQSAGIKAKTLLRPLFFVGVFCTLANLAIMEFVTPYSLNSIDKFYDAHLRRSYRGKRTDPLHVMQLEDHSKLVYQYYDAAKEAFFDVIWIKNSGDLWRMKYLKADPDNPRGSWIDHLKRNADGVFEKTQSFSSLVLSDLQWKEDLPRRGIPFENRSISELYTLFKSDPLLSTYEKSEVLSHILFKCSIPLLSLLVIIAVAPFCFVHTRNLHQLPIYGISLFGLVAFVALLDAMVILGENETIPPYIAILAPFAILFGLSTWNFVKAR